MAGIFFFNSVIKLLEHFKINNHFINLKKSKQPVYSPIYSLGPIQLKISKTYIKTNFVNGFIKSLKLLAVIPILFVFKKTNSFWLYVNHWRLHNLIIKIHYLFLLIEKSFNQLSQTKCFIPLNLLKTYHQIKIWKKDELKTVFQTQ